MKVKLVLFIFLFTSCSNPRKTVSETEVNHFPANIEKVSSLPAKENFYLFILAGQSNMAGRGFVQPQDTISHPRVLTLNANSEWVYAKEPLHYYEPTRTGLDCGLSFGKELASLYGKKITIGLIPCAVGGSSIEQWLGDSTFRNVALYSNLIKRAKSASANGIIKGILWHQGETNASAANYKNYKEKAERFFTKLRNGLGDHSLPVYTGLLASFLSRRSNPFADSINKDLQTIAGTINHFYIVNTTDLTPKSDSIHFDSRSQRTMGKRFARIVYKTR